METIKIEKFDERWIPILRDLKKTLGSLPTPVLKQVEIIFQELMYTKHNINPSHKYCGKCGTRLVTNAKFCFECSAPTPK